MRNATRRTLALLMTALMLLSTFSVGLADDDTSNIVLPGNGLLGGLDVSTIMSVINPDTDAYKTYTFYVDGSAVSTQIVKDGDTLHEPEAPTSTEAGKVFAGWYDAATGGTKFASFGAQAVSASGEVSLYAQFKTAYYVYFYTPDGSKLVATRVATDRNANSYVGVTYETGTTQSVIGWAAEPNGTTDVSASFAVTSGVSANLYAILGDGFWVKFDAMGGSLVDPVYSDMGGTVTNFATPTRSGYTFGGWYNNAECTGNAVTSATSAVTLFAKWIADSNANYTVAYWLQNANDDGYTLVGTTTCTGAVGSEAAAYWDHADNITITNDQKATNDRNSHPLLSDPECYVRNPDKTNESNPSIAGDGSTVKNVYYTRKTYTLKYYNGRTAINNATHTVRFGQSTAGFKSQLASSYSKYIWYPTLTNNAPSGSPFSAPPAMPAKDLNLYGKAGDKFLVIFDATSTIRYLDENNNPIRDAVVVYGTNFSLTAEDYINIDGFTYDASKTAAYTDFWSFIGDWLTGTRDYTFYYTRNNYEIVFNTNGGMPLVTNATGIPYESTIGLNRKPTSYAEGRTTKVHNGVTYTFTGWFDAAGNAFDFENAKMPAGDLMLFAGWSAGTFTVTFDTAGGSTAPAARTVTPGQTITKPADPTKAGFTFAGWMKDGKPFDFGTPISGDTTLVAKWLSTAAFTVAYDAGDGAGTVPTDSTSYGDGMDAMVKDKGGMTAPADKPYFLGWNTKADGSGTIYQPGEPMTIDSTLAVSGVVTLFAMWGTEPPTATLTYDANYESADPATEPHADGTTTVFPNNGLITLYGVAESAFTRTNYKLVGWNTAADGTGESYALGEEVRIDNLDTNVLYAVWAINVADVTITKTVTGNMGDTNKAFEFRIEGYMYGDCTIDASSGVTYNQVSGENGYATFSLKDGQSITFKDIVLGAPIDITETAPGYTVTVNGQTLTNGVYAPDAVVTKDMAEIEFVNNKELLPQTGVLLDSLPYVLILALVAAGVVLVIIRKRKQRDDD